VHVSRGDEATGNKASDNNDDNNNNADDDWGWKLHNKAVHAVPAFYPMDPRSTRRVNLASQDEGGEESSIGEISHRISTACQSLSIHGIWNNTSPSATLCSMERVEMEITIYLGDVTSTAPRVLLIEVQRRKGCSITFHNYRRSLLDAAEGKFDPNTFNQTDGLEKPLGRDRCNQPRASLGRPGLARPGLARPNLSSSGRPNLVRPSLSPPGSSGLARPGLARPNLARPSSSPPGSSSLPRPGLARPSLSSSGRPNLARPSLSPPGSSSLARPSPMGRPSLARPSPFRPPSMDQSSAVVTPSLRSPSFSADDAAMPIAGLKTEGESPKHGEDGNTVEKALKALNMAASLIKKDRADAQRLGMESLVLLTDPLRAGMETAKIASRVVLLGSANDDDVGMGNNEDDVDALFDESAGLGIRETILEMIMADSGADEKMTSEDDGFEGIEKEFTDCLVNLCLTVLSNALHTIEESVKTAASSSSAGAAPSNNLVEQDDSSDDDDSKPSPSNRQRAATEPSALPSGVSKRFIDDTKSTFGCDVLSSLIRILGQAKTNPHDAYHSARCLGVLFKGCGNSHKARARRDLDAKSIISAALEVGSRSHAKLEGASRVAMMALMTDDEGSVEEEKEEEEEERETTEMENAHFQA